MTQQHKVGVLLVNLGTPHSPAPGDVYRYLIEFLTDGRVIDYPWLAKQLLVRGLIVPLRYKRSAKQYQQIWTSEGSPLMMYGQRVRAALKQSLGSAFEVALAMRYQGPTIESQIQKLLAADVTHLVVLPLFPQYASSTTGSVHQEVMRVLSKELVLPKLTMIQGYADHPAFIDALAAVADGYNLEDYDYYLMSFHGLPERHIRNGDRSGVCLKSNACCHTLRPDNASCYRAQCFATARALAEQLNLPDDRWSVSFQSRLGKEKWMTPYTVNRVKELAKRGVKRLLLFSPSFVCDCLETLFEAEIELSDDFCAAGGERLQLVKSLNEHPIWISALKELVLDQLNDRERPAASKTVATAPSWN